MSLLEFFIYITLINWSILTLLWLFIKKKDQFYLKDLYWGGGIALLELSSMALQSLLEVSDFHVRQILVTFLTLVLGIKLFLFTNKKRKLIIWPEASLPLVLRDKSNWTEWIKKLVVLKKTYLLFGALGHSPNDDNKELYNSVFLFDSSGTKIARYDKKHLVPFGEYVPFKDYLFFVNNSFYLF